MFEKGYNFESARGAKKLGEEPLVNYVIQKVSDQLDEVLVVVGS